MKPLMRSFLLSLPVLLSYILYLCVYLFMLLWVPVPIPFLFLFCNLALWAGIYLWMEWVDSKRKISWQEFGFTLPLFCLEYSLVWKALQKWGVELFEWPIVSMVDFINAAYREQHLPFPPGQSMPWDVLTLDLWTTHAVSMGFFLFLLVTVRLIVGWVDCDR